MSDRRTRHLVETVLAEKVRAGEMFTAYDISRESQWRGSPQRHRHMKHVVHDSYDRGAMAGYVRTLVAIPGAPEPAWLYHRPGDDPEAFRPRERSGFFRSARRVDRRARLCVPVARLRAAGLQPGDLVVAVVDAAAPALVLKRLARPGGPPAGKKTYTVERNGNLRIGQRTLRKAGRGGCFFEIGGDRRRVTLRLARPSVN
jgi:hypothetical protein